MAKEVFISYKSDEFDDANWVRSILENNGISCWMAPSCIPGGSNYAEEIPKAIKGCKVFVLILSQKSQESKWVPKEIDQAINEGKIIMPFMIENCSLKDDFNFYLSNIQRYYAYENKVAAIKTMIEEICAVLGRPAPCAEETNEPEAAAEVQTAEPEVSVPAKNEEPVVEKPAKVKTKKPFNKKKIIIPLAVVASVIIISVIAFFISIFSGAGTVIIAGEEYYADLSWLEMEDATLSQEDVDTISGLELTSVHLTNCSFPDTLYDVMNNKDLFSVALVNCGITDEDLKKLDFSELTTVDLSGNKSVTNLDFAENFNEYISYLDISRTSVTDISPLKNHTNLSELYIAGLGLDDFSAISTLTSITVLDVSGNALTDLDDASTLIYLENFFGADNPLESADGLSNCTILKTLDLSSTGISDISVIEKSAETLEKLILNNNKISDITSVGKLTNLEELNLSNNNITTLDALSTVSTLETLSVRKNEITDLSALSSNTKLSSLDASFNNISGTVDLSFIAYENQTTLKLYINDNPAISGLVISGINVSEADIRNTAIADFSTITDAEIYTLNLTYNSLTDYSTLEPLISSTLSIYQCPLDKRIALENIFGYKIKFADAEPASETA